MRGVGGFGDVRDVHVFEEAGRKEGEQIVGVDNIYPVHDKRGGCVSEHDPDDNRLRLGVDDKDKVALLIGMMGNIDISLR